MNPSNKNSHGARGVPRPTSRRAEQATQTTPAAARLKTGAPSRGLNSPAAPPPARRPETPKAAQPKTANGVVKRAVAPPAYHPEAKKLVQPKAASRPPAPPAAQARTPPKSPAVYNPRASQSGAQTSRPAVQRKVAAAAPSRGGGRPTAAPTPNANAHARLAPPAQALRPAVVQRMKWSDFYDRDDAGGQDGEMYLYQQKQQERKEREKKKRRERNAELLTQCKCKYRHHSYVGKDALVVQIIKQECDLLQNDYGNLLIDRAVMAMSSQTPPPDLSPDEILATDNDFKEAVVNCFEKQVDETHGKTDTQFGLTSNYTSNFRF